MKKLHLILWIVMTCSLTALELYRYDTTNSQTALFIAGYYIGLLFALFLCMIKSSIQKTNERMNEALLNAYKALSEAQRERIEQLEEFIKKSS